MFWYRYQEAVISASRQPIRPWTYFCEFGFLLRIHPAKLAARMVAFRADFLSKGRPGGFNRSSSRESRALSSVFHLCTPTTKSFLATFMFQRHFQIRTAQKNLCRVGFLLGAISLAFLNTSSKAGDSYQAWRQIYNIADIAQNSQQQMTAIAMDSHGNVAVTGFEDKNGRIFYTAKYDGLDGHVIWEQTYNSGFGDNVPHAITCDSVGNVIVTGGSASSRNGHDQDVLTIKYDVLGNIVWTQIYDNATVHGEDQGLKVIVDSNDDVIVTAKSVGDSVGYDFFTIKYQAAFPGTAKWTGTRYNGSGNGDDVPAALAVDDSNNVYVTGTTKESGQQKYFYTAKYAAANGGLVWNRFYTGAEDSGATALTISKGPAFSVIVTGYTGNADGTTSIFTRSYDSAGTLQWSATPNIIQENLGDSFGFGGVGVVTDSLGNVIVTGTAVKNDIFDSKVYYTVKYTGGSGGGSVLWRAETQSLDNDDEAAAIAIGGDDNVVVTGFSRNPDEHDADFDTFKYSGVDGSTIWERRYTGVNKDGTGLDEHQQLEDGALDNFSAEEDDIPTGLAIDGLGNVAVGGTSKLPFLQLSVFHTRFATMKYDQFLVQTGDPITGTGVPNDAKVTSISSPAISDTATSSYRLPAHTAITAQVTAAAGKKKVTTILNQGSTAGTFLPAVQKQAAPDAAGNTSQALYKTFSDPLMASDGSYAFAAKLTGPKGTPSSAVWSTTFNVNHVLQRTLDAGSDLHNIVADVAAGTTLKSIVSTSMVDGQLLALLKVAGATKGEVLVCLTSATSGKLLLYTGKSITAGASDSTVKSFTVLTPPIGSAGDGRWQGTGKIVAKATLADKRTVILNVATATGVYTVDLVTGGDASIVTNGATWKAFGLPAIGGQGICYALQTTLSGASSSADTALVISIDGINFAKVAVEGQTIPGGGPAFASFFDPLVNDFGSMAFTATVKGQGVTGKNKTGLWYKTLLGNLTEIVRLGDTAPQPINQPTLPEATFSGFVSVALPDGGNSGPVFLAKLSGKGVNGKNNLGLYAWDSTNKLRELLRTGDVLESGDADTVSQDTNKTTPEAFRTVTKMTLLQAVKGDFGATRSYNSTGGVSLLIGLSDKTQALIDIGIP